MTSLVYPNNILGLSFNCVRTPDWNTLEQRAVSNKRSTVGLQLYPIMHFELDYELLRDDLAPSDLKALVGLFNACKGKYDDFLFQDPDFNIFLPSNQQLFYTADGTVGPFQLVATYQNPSGPGYAELIQNLNGTPVIYGNSVALSNTNYVIGPTGLVTFNAGHAPAAGVALTWSGSFFYRCAFDEDKLDLSKFMNQWWAAKKVAFTSIKL